VGRWMLRGVAAAALAACSLIDLSVLQSKPPDAGMEAETDAAAIDAASDGPMTWCSSVDAQLCEDFDRVPFLDAGWGLNVSDGGNVADWPFTYVTPPRAVRADLRALPDAAPMLRTALLDKLLDFSKGRRAIVEWDAFFDTDPFTSAGGLIYYAYAVQNGASSVGLAQTESGWFVLGLAPGASYPLAQPLPMRQWVRLRFDVIFEATPIGKILLELVGDGGNTTLVSKTGIVTTMETSSQTVLVGFGVINSVMSPSDMPRATVIVDDVVVWTP